MAGFDYAIDPPGNYDEPEVEWPDEPRLSPTDAMLNALEERILRARQHVRVRAGEAVEMKDNESVYDEKIRPLMEQIIAICKVHGIPVFATFQYSPESDDEGAGLCSTYIPADEQCPVFEKLRRVAVSGWDVSPALAAFTVLGVGK